MGVPRLFKWINEKCPKAISSYNFNNIKTVKYVDNLFIDTNAIIHEYAQIVFNYGSFKRFLYRYKNYTIQQKIEKIYEKTFNKILDISNFVKPKKLLYIAIDGVAPAGKMSQQRQRRFVASLSLKEDLDFTKNFSPNCISPGTEFMKGLISYFNYRILSCKSIPNIIFSSSNVAGEGEHKAMNYLRNHVNINESNAIFGPDGDLIMLALTVPHKFLLIRDDQYNINITNIIDINLIKIKLLETFKNIEDFILLGFFVGNDFLPKIQMFYLLEDGMNFLSEIYKELNLELVDNYNINHTNFKKLCEKIQEYEEEFLNSQIKINQNIEEKFKNNTLLSCVENKKLNYEIYKINYKSKINFDKSIIKEYIKGIEWVFDYYLGKPIDFTFCYKYHYAPLIYDLNNFYKIPIKSKKLTIPLTPYQQLLAILPKKSKILIPKEFHFIYEKFPEYYPEIFEIDYEGKYQDYQGIAYLPFVNIDDIRIDTKEILGYILFFRQSDKKIKYKTNYGIIESNMKITKK